MFEKGFRPKAVEAEPEKGKESEPEEIKREAGELVLEARGEFFKEYGEHLKAGNIGIAEQGLAAKIERTIAIGKNKKRPGVAEAAAKRFIDENRECSRIFLDGTEKAVVESLKKHLNFSPEEIAERLGLDIEEVNQYLGVEEEHKIAA